MAPAPPEDVVILAAGQGTRLRRHERDYPKPLYPLLGRPLIAYVFEAFCAAGARRFHVVVGFEKDQLVAELPALVPPGATLDLIDNPHWRLSNGVSLLQARGHLERPFYLSMSDHLFPSELVRTLGAAATAPGDLYLAVDRKLDSIFDMDDATKVRSEAGRIVDIGKRLTAFDAVDTGVFVCPPALFDALEAARVGGDCGLSDGVRAFAAQGRARVVDIGAAFWQDLDTPAMMAHAEAWLRAPASPRLS